MFMRVIVGVFVLCGFFWLSAGVQCPVTSRAPIPVSEGVEHARTLIRPRKLHTHRHWLGTGGKVGVDFG